VKFGMGIDDKHSLKTAYEILFVNEQFHTWRKFEVIFYIFNVDRL
jgi:hypothetical protein